MKKTQLALQRKTNRLSLSRETIRLLDDPALLELARGGRTDSDSMTTLTIPTTQESTSQGNGNC